MHPNPNFASTLQWILPVVIGIIFCALSSLIKEPARKNYMTVMIAGAGAAYLSGGGFGKTELAFLTLMTLVAYLASATSGPRAYQFIGIGWLLHTAWDVAHHLYGNPLLPFSATSSLGCAICDPVIAAWCFAGAPTLFRRRPMQAA